VSGKARAPITIRTAHHLIAARISEFAISK
jgi:hypothetical protein